jgi:hypothetical protein
MSVSYVSPSVCAAVRAASDFSAPLVEQLMKNRMVNRERAQALLLLGRLPGTGVLRRPAGRARLSKWTQRLAWPGLGVSCSSVRECSIVGFGASVSAAERKPFAEQRS